MIVLGRVGGGAHTVRSATLRRQRSRGCCARIGEIPHKGTIRAISSQPRTLEVARGPKSGQPHHAKAVHPYCDSERIFDLAEMPDVYPPAERVWIHCGAHI